MQNLMLNVGGDLQVYLFFGCLPLLIILERLIPKRRPTTPQIRRLRTNVALTAIVILTLPLVPVSFITAAFWAETYGIGLLHSFEVEAPMGVIVLVTLAVRSFVSFGTHYLNHKVPLLWRFHRVHHFDTELDVSSTVRFHPVEMPLSMLIGLPLVIACGLSPWVLVLYELFDVVVTLFSHSNVRVAPKLNRWLRYVIVTPDLHRVHHSVDVAETDSNFSAVFPVWDIIFGTFRTETRDEQETMRLGIEDVAERDASSLGWLLVSPFRRDPDPTTAPLMR